MRVVSAKVRNIISFFLRELLTVGVTSQEFIDLTYVNV